MDYKLAKQLKDAGLKQKIEVNNWFILDGMKTPHRLTKKDIERSKPLIEARYCFIPTLEPLIYACGDGFGGLVRMTDIQNKKKVVWWQAYMTEKAFDKTGIACVRDCCGYETGDTPLIAVVELYLVLNPKTK